MQEDTIKDVINDAYDLANTMPDADLLRLGIEKIANRLSQLVETQEDKQARKSKIPVIKTPVGATLAFIAHNPELPRLTAILREVRGEEVRGENKDLTPHPAPHTQEIDIYADNTMLAEMTVYRGKDFAVNMVRAALKGAMSRLGRHRRQEANRKLAKLSEEEK